MIKYQLPYKSIDESEWLLTIDLPTYSGDPITVSGVEGKSGILNYEGSVDEVWDNHLVNVTLTSELYNEGQIDVTELQLVEDRTVLVTLTRNGQIKFKGWLISDGMQYEFNNLPSTVQITATSGLNLLDGISYSGFGGELGQRVPLNFFRRILQNSNQLGIQLPIRWTPTVQQNITLEDAFTSSIWSANGQGYYNLNIKTDVITYVDCKYIIEGMAQSLKCRVIQIDGAWWVLGISESINDVLAYKECANYTGTPIITNHSISIVKNIGSDYLSIQNDSVLTVLPALSKIDVVYNQKQRTNIIPNGGQDEFILGSIPLHWSGETGLLYGQGIDITSQGGSSIELNNLTTEEKKYYLIGALPIDANVLYKTLTFGFSFMPLEGFKVDENGFIIWDDNNKIKVSIKYIVDDGSGNLVYYFLNEFGYWSSGGGLVGDGITIVSVTQTIDSVIVKFGGTASVIGQQYNLSYTENDDPNPSFDIYQTYTFTSSVPFATALTEIASSTGGTVVGDTIEYGVINPSNASAYFAGGAETPNYMYFSQENLKLNDAVAISYRGSSSFDMFIKDPGFLGLNAPKGVGRLSIEFFVRRGYLDTSVTPNVYRYTKMLLDDVWMNLEDNSDLYSIENTLTKNANKKEIGLNISSSFNGFYESNFMRNYSNSDTDWIFNDGVNQGSLTELYARSVMRSRYKPNFIYNGTISTRGKDWSFLNCYTINGLEGKRFIPLNPTYNTSRNEVSLIALEYVYDDIDMQVIHKGSKDEIND